MTVFERIESLRKSRGISQGKLEKELKFSNGSVSKWKNSLPSSERLQKLANYFGVSTEYILTGKEDVNTSEKYYFNEETAKAAQEIFENKELKALFDATRDADAEDLKALHAMALALKRKEKGTNDD